MHSQLLSRCNVLDAVKSPCDKCEIKKQMILLEECQPNGYVQQISDFGRDCPCDATLMYEDSISDDNAAPSNFDDTLSILESWYDVMTDFITGLGFSGYMEVSRMENKKIENHLRARMNCE